MEIKNNTCRVNLNKPKIYHLWIEEYGDVELNVDQNPKMELLYPDPINPNIAELYICDMLVSKNVRIKKIL